MVGLRLSLPLSLNGKRSKNGAPVPDQSSAQGKPASPRAGPCPVTITPDRHRRTATTIAFTPVQPLQGTVGPTLLRSNIRPKSRAGGAEGSPPTRSAPGVPRPPTVGRTTVTPPSKASNKGKAKATTMTAAPPKPSSSPMPMRLPAGLLGPLQITIPSSSSTSPSSKSPRSPGSAFALGSGRSPLSAVFGNRPALRRSPSSARVLPTASSVPRDHTREPAVPLASPEKSVKRPSLRIRRRPEADSGVLGSPARPPPTPLKSRRVQPKVAASESPAALPSMLYPQFNVTPAGLAATPSPTPLAALAPRISPTSVRLAARRPRPLDLSTSASTPLFGSLAGSRPLIQSYISPRTVSFERAAPTTCLTPLNVPSTPLSSSLLSPAYTGSQASSPLTARSPNMPLFTRIPLERRRSGLSVGSDPSKAASLAETDFKFGAIVQNPAGRNPIPGDISPSLLLGDLRVLSFGK